MQLDTESVVVAVKDQLSSNVGGEVVVLHLGKGVYYGLDAVGARVWGLVQGPRRVAEICAALLEEYDVDAERCERAVLGLLGELAEAGLIEAADAAAA